MKKLFTFLGLLVLCFSMATVFTPTRAQENTVEVDHVARGFEKVQEKLTLFFKFSKQAKLDYRLELVEKRLAELKYGVDNNKLDLIEETASRYSTYLGKAFEYSENKNLTVKNKDKLLETFDRHSKIISELQAKYEYDSAYWLSTQHDLNILKQYIDKLNNS